MLCSVCSLWIEVFAVVTGSFETLVTVFQTTRCHVPEHNNRQSTCSLRHGVRSGCMVTTFHKKAHPNFPSLLLVLRTQCAYSQRRLCKEASIRTNKRGLSGHPLSCCDETLQCSSQIYQAWNKQPIVQLLVEPNLISTVLLGLDVVLPLCVCVTQMVAARAEECSAVVKPTVYGKNMGNSQTTRNYRAPAKRALWRAMPNSDTDVMKFRRH
jgi:hypothetical protein